MKVLICSLALCLALPPASAVQAQTVEKSRTVKESFVVGKDAEIEIANKYGSIHIIPWNKDSVRFEVEIVVKGNKQSKVDKSFDFIEIDFKTSKYYIIAQTLFAGKSSFWSDVSDLTGAIFNTGTKTMINYKVHVPSNARLKVQNKYGNIYTTDHSGPIEIDLSNGDLKAHHFKGESIINTEFGIADIDLIDNGQLTIMYGELRLENGGKIELESKSSEFYIEKVDELMINSRRDKFNITQSDVLRGTHYFSKIVIGKLNKKLDLQAKYGEIEIEQFGDQVNSFNLKTEDTDIVLHFTDQKFYDMDILVDKETQVMYSADIENISSSEINGEEKLIQVKCTTGPVTGKKIPIEIDSRAGTLSLKLK